MFRVAPVVRALCRGPWAAGVFCCAVLLSAPSQAGDPDIASHLAAAGVDPANSTMVVRRLSDGATWHSNAKRAGTRFSPASTSKIVHTLIALESGAATPGTVFRWDGTATWNADWNRDQTLGSAFRVSAVWVFQRLVSDVGADTMAHWIDRLDYGNRTIGTNDTLTTYWLDGTLTISAQEQIAFLSRLARRELSLAPSTYGAAQTIMQVDTGPGWTLYGKAGWRHSDDVMDIGWYVGWLRCGDDHYVFALNLDMPDPSMHTTRKAGAIAALEGIGAFQCR